ncbi:tRNA pseudouridine(38-40) synthase TruA [Candidatus Cytomitobacter indipagum]|uniref:tRNA pseudouridine synthase A n=1 Tax=Candidatus Cytomitobacter indipagum TaxID=2601575 RepID=A0A5C0UDD5_9PROT|nr:tRNA pseudouridine(38-40) synthase TruA [Candidatus Cytomitobacter indipagum]QEK37801.1 tRNA pseudouridine(38-40) synthase TruA [Candidatus Cytomitobacter indipagum]
MFRYKFTIEYDGAAANAGWQVQPGKISIQSLLSDAAFELSKSKILFYGSGRTDRGVHALGQVAHADFFKSYPLFSLKQGMNFYLTGKKVAIKEVELVSQDFHARFSAKIKTYRYDICMQDYPNVINLKNWRISRNLDIKKMEEESKFLLGVHDFASFRSSHCQAATSIRSIDEINFIIRGNILSVYFVGKSFLHNQIRAMIGTLVDIGMGRQINIKSIMQSKDRKKAGQTAPPGGLFLEKIDFD